MLLTFEYNYYRSSKIKFSHICMETKLTKVLQRKEIV